MKDLVTLEICHDRREIKSMDQGPHLCVSVFHSGVNGRHAPAVRLRYRGPLFQQERALVQLAPASGSAQS